METQEDAQDFLNTCDGMLESLATDSESLYQTFEELFGRVTDRASFSSFYTRFIQSCPNPKIAEGHDSEEEAMKLWATIDANHNNLLDKEECRSLVEATIKKSMELTRNFFGMNN
jgi:hypothetical protein